MQYTIQNKDAKIAVLCGGMSSEREVSLRSGKNCLGALHRLGYKNAEIVDVSPNVMNDLKGFEIPKVVYLSKESFSADNNLSTPTMKLKHAEIKKKFAKEIEEMYKAE